MSTKQKLCPYQYFDALKSAGVKFFTGVPDSLLKEFNAVLLALAKPNEHIIAANEGNAIALAAGHYLATSSPALVYLQNSGLLNSGNPLLSLAHKEVYSIPMVLMVGWRGEPGVKDEPQHVVQGRATLQLIEDMGFQHEVLQTSCNESASDQIARLIALAKDISAPVFLVVRANSFATAHDCKEDLHHTHAFPAPPALAGASLSMTRRQALSIVMKHLSPHSAVVSSTGKMSREWNELRESAASKSSPTALKSLSGKGAHHSIIATSDFLTVGSMGHSSSIALGIALAQPERKLICLDGDGAAIMHMGALATIGSLAPQLKNFCHIVINNGSHESVGAQPTVAISSLDLCGVAKSAGYVRVERVDSEEALNEVLHRWNDDAASSSSSMLSFLEVRVSPFDKSASVALSRPQSTPADRALAFKAFLQAD